MVKEYEKYSEWLQGKIHEINNIEAMLETINNCKVVQIGVDNPDGAIQIFRGCEYFEEPYIKLIANMKIKLFNAEEKIEAEIQSKKARDFAEGEDAE